MKSTIGKVLLLFTLFFVSLSGFVVRQVEVPVETKCSGGFDVYFVLDTSSSISDEHFQDQTVNFVEELLSRFTSTKVRVSFITFASMARTVLPLTGDRTEIKTGLQSLREITPSGSTKLSLGLQHAGQQIELEGGNAASVVIALTDGVIGNDKTEAEKEANTTRDFGATVLAIRVGKSEIEDLLGVANTPPENYIFRGDSFDDLEDIIAQIVDTSCVEILSVTPEVVCTNEAFNVSIYGNGFDKTLNISTVYCNFKLNGTNQRVQPLNVTSTYLLCQSPQIVEDGGVVEIEVSVNGKSFVSSNVTVTAFECLPPNVLPIILSILGAGLLIGLFLLWWFWNLLCCAVVVKDKPPPTPPPEPTPEPVRPPPEPPRLVPGPPKVKSWPKVDVSLIGGVGAGGIKPVQVRWGSSGNTEAALHLEKGKGASVVGKIEKETPGQLVPERPPPITKPLPPPPPPAEKHRGCCFFIPEKLAKLFQPVKSLYDRVSLMRPQPGEKGKCCNFRREA